jgi:hypothetical protein
MKPVLSLIKGRVVSLESTLNGYTVELLDVNNKYYHCFLSTEELTKFASQYGEIKPKAEIKIKACKDIGMYGEERFSIEFIKPSKNKDSKRNEN